MYFRGSQILKYMKGKVKEHHTNTNSAIYSFLVVISDYCIAGNFRGQ